MLSKVKLTIGDSDGGEKKFHLVKKLFLSLIRN